MTAATALALSELRILTRDRIAAFNVVIVPVVAAIYLIVNPPPADELPEPVAAAGASVVLAVFASASMVLRSVTTPAPGVLLLARGVALIFPALAIALQDAPAQPAVLVLAVVLAAAIGGAGATLAAAFARTSEAAATVALPLFAGLLGGGTTLVPSTRSPGRSAPPGAEP